MSIRTNRRKAVPSVQKRLTSVKSIEKEPNIAKKLDKLMSKLNSIKDLFSTVKSNEEELLDTLKDVDDLLRNFNTEKFNEISKRILHSDNATKANQEKDVAIDKKFESLKSELDYMKAMFSEEKKNEELFDKIRAVEDLLQNFNAKSFDEIAKPTQDAIQSETKNLASQTSEEELGDQDFKDTGVDKPSSSQEAQDKKSVEKDVPVDKKLESLKSELENMKAKFSIVKKNEELICDTLRALEDLLRNFNAKSSAEIVKPAEDANQSEAEGLKLPSQTSKELVVDHVFNAVGKRIKDSTKKLGVSQSEPEADDPSSQDKASTTVQHSILSLSQHNDGVNLLLKRFQASYDALNLHAKLCCLSLSVFPENAVIKKRHIIYWWIGEGFVKNTTEKTAEKEGEDVFDELLSSNLIVPHGNVKCPVVNKFTIKPWIRHMLVSSVLGEVKQPFGIYSQIILSSRHNDAHGCLVLDQKKVEISGKFGSKFDHWRSVFNLGASYLNIEPQWMAKMKKLVVLQLGRWQEMPDHHIEVDSAEFMRDLKAQKHLKYLSLRGISRITELPSSIAQLVSLQILDLKACHNLETLPSEIASLKKLTHLDVSQCYFLESMPKGIEKLTELQVLKGFVVGNSTKTARVSDLGKLKKLKRLSIHIGSEAVIQDGEYETLKEFEAVKCLKISWGVLSNTRHKDIEIILPSSCLEKLDIEGFPSDKVPEWLKPNNLPPGLKKLYIKGGKLTSMGQEKRSSMSKVEIVRLKYLKHLQIDDKNLQKMFPSLKYAEGKQVWNRSFEWSIEDGKSTSMS